MKTLKIKVPRRKRRAGVMPTRVERDKSKDHQRLGKHKPKPE